MLTDAGHVVTIIAPDPVFIGFWRGIQWNDTTENGIRILRFKVPSWPIGLRWVERIHYRMINKKIAKWVARLETEVEVIHAHSVYPALLVARPLAKYYRRGLVLTEHRPSSLDRPVSGFRGRALWSAVQHCQVRSVVSQAFAILLAEHWRTSPWSVLPLPVKDDFFKQARSVPDVFTFLHVSHLDPGKRVDLLLEAFSNVRKNNESAVLRIVGGKPEQIEVYAKQAERMGITDSVVFTGAQDREGIAREMAQASCFVLFSEREAGGTVLSEAQACGTPIIATDTWAGQFAVAPHSGILCKINDLASLTDAMVQMIHSNYDRNVIREKAYERYSAEAFVKSSVELYRRSQL